MVRKVPAIPSVPPGSPRELTIFLNAVKSVLDNLGVTTSEELVTQTELDQAISGVTAGTTTIIQTPGGTPTTDPPDTTPPGIATNLEVFDGFGTAFLDWDSFPSSPVSVAYAKIYRKKKENPGDPDPIWSTSDPLILNVGTSRISYYVDTLDQGGEYYYWITYVSEAGVEGPENTAIGTTVTSDFDGSFIKAYTITANKLFIDELSAISATLGDVTAGTLSSDNGPTLNERSFVIDLIDEYIRITDGGEWSNSDYIQIDAGTVNTYKYINGTHYEFAKLVAIEAGTANNNETITITNKYFGENQPKIVVSVRDMPSYSPTYKFQEQSLFLSADNISYFPTIPSLEFDITAELRVGAGTATQNSFFDSGVVSTDTILSDEFLTEQSNVVGIGGTFSVVSYRGTGAAGNFKRRQCTLYIEVKVWNAPDTDSWTILDSYGPFTLNAEVANEESANFSYATPSPGKWKFRIRAEFQDGGGSDFTAPTQQIPKTEILAASSGLGPHEIASSSGNNNSLFTRITLPAWSLPPGGTLTQIKYTWSATGYIEADRIGGTSGYTVSTVSDSFDGTITSFGSVQDDDPALAQFQGGGIAKLEAVSNREEFSTDPYDDQIIGYGLQVTHVGSGNTGEGLARITFDLAQAIIDYTEPVSGDASPRNRLFFSEVQLRFAESATELEGDLYYIVLGVDDNTPVVIPPP